ncbi:MAG: prolipoprotein diacylglyceryl transferase [Deltaproteobacteria bacterium]|nr:prolipoprotein diacylglyceryl transferase [Deltaproteobacteria bacterium]
MRPVLFRLGDYAVSSFWLAAFAGFFAAFLVVRAQMRQRGMDLRLAYDMTLWAYIGGWVGARLFLIPTAWAQFTEDPLAFLTAASGWVWYGGLIGGGLAVTAWARRQGLALIDLADIAAPALAIGLGFGRIGCQLSGDGDYGLPTSLPWGMSYPDGVVPTNERVHPTPVYEMVVCFALFGWLWRRRRHSLPRGAQIGTYLMVAALTRFLIEFLRRNPHWLLGLSTAQWFSLAALLCGGALLARARVPAPAGQ